MNSTKLLILTFASLVSFNTAFGASGTTYAIPTAVAAQSDGSVLIYTAATGPNICGGVQGDFVIPTTVSEGSRSRMLGIALAGKASQTTLAIYYDGTCVGARHVVYIVQSP